MGMNPIKTGNEGTNNEEELISIQGDAAFHSAVPVIKNDANNPSEGETKKTGRKKRARRNPEKREFNCDRCPYSSGYKENVVKHMKIRHERVKDIHCSMCTFRTNVRTNLTHHVEAVHLKKKKFECPYCEYRFVQKRNLQNHIKRNHEKKSKKDVVR